MVEKVQLAMAMEMGEGVVILEGEEVLLQIMRLDQGQEVHHIFLVIMDAILSLKIQHQQIFHFLMTPFYSGFVFHHISVSEGSKIKWNDYGKIRILCISNAYSDFTYKLYKIPTSFILIDIISLQK